MILRYEVWCPRCGKLDTSVFFGDACQSAQRHQQQHAGCGDLTVVNQKARRGVAQTFDRFGETLEVRA